MVEHHFVILASEAGFFAASERGVGGVIVVAIYPDTTGFDSTRDLVELVCVAGPDAGTEAVKRVVSDRDGVGFILECGDGRDRAEDLFLEDSHLVVAFEQGRLDIETVFEAVRILMGFAAAEDLGTFALPIGM